MLSKTWEQTLDGDYKCKGLYIFITDDGAELVRFHTDGLHRTLKTGSLIECLRYGSYLLTRRRKK